MGQGLIEFYKSKVKRTWKIAFFSTFVICLLVHLYKYTNTLPNHDSVFCEYTSQDITTSGRWFLQYACGISSYFDLPWINGLLSAVYLGIAAAVIAELFDITNPVVIVLSGGILAACPATTETMFFEYTADGYMLGLLLSVTACLSCRDNRLREGTLCTAYSCACPLPSISPTFHLW